MSLDKDALADLMVLVENLATATNRMVQLSAAQSKTTAGAFLLHADPAATAVAKHTLANIPLDIDFPALTDALRTRRRAAGELLHEQIAKTAVRPGAADEVLIHRAVADARELIAEFDRLVAGAVE